MSPVRNLPPSAKPEAYRSSSCHVVSEDDHFSDASEGHPRPDSRHSSRVPSPTPRTRVDKVDSEPSHGEVPGTSAYHKREQDAIPDEIEIIPDGLRSRRLSTAEESLTPGGSPIPRTLVTKVDSTTPGHGEVPGTDAYKKRRADAVPDLILKLPEDRHEPTAHDRGASEHLPGTLLSRVDSLPEDPSSPGLRAHRRSPSDALPDATETLRDTTGKPDLY